MGELSGQFKAGLSHVARLALRRAAYGANSVDSNLVQFRTDFRTMRPEIVSYIREQIESASDGAQTVRQLATPLRKMLGGYSVIELVLCDASTADGEVATLTEGMFVFAVAAAEAGYIPVPV